MSKQTELHTQLGGEAARARPGVLDGHAEIQAKFSQMGNEIGREGGARPQGGLISWRYLRPGVAAPSGRDLSANRP